MCTVCTSFTPAGPTCKFANAAVDEALEGSMVADLRLPNLPVRDVADLLTIDFWDGFLGVPGPFIFDLGPERDLTVNLTALRSTGEDLARAALDVWSSVTDIHFVETRDPDAEIAFIDTDPGGYGGPELIRGDFIESSIVNVSHDLVRAHGDEIGTLSFFYYLHEIGHALGLGHPGQYNAAATFRADAGFANDSWQMSVMSYFDQDANPNIDASYAIPVTPMMADIAAIQSLYGTGDGVHVGDTTYGSDTSGGRVKMFSTSQDPVAKTLVDTGGIDLIDLSADHSGVRLDLKPGSFSDVLGLIGNLAIAPGSIIENAQTGDGADAVTGNGAANWIRTGAGNDTVDGGGGDDRIDGGAGSDWLNGGSGRDTALYAGPIDSYSVELTAANARISSPDGTDTLISIEHVTFGSAAPFAPDGMFDLSAFDGVAALSAAELTTLAEMYIAYFDRAPDAAGLFYWGTRLADGMTMPEIAASFFVQPESQAAFPDAADSAALVDAAYANLLERAPDAEGRAYWINQLETGAITREGFMLDLINGARANANAQADVRTVSDKADIGLSFAVIHGLNETEAARLVMEAYDRSDPSAGLDRARDRIDDAIETAGFTLALSGVIDDPFAVA